MPRSPQSRRWCFTLNNPEEALFPEEWKDCRFCIWQLEAGESGTPHFQGYCEFKRPTRLTRLKQILESAHWEPARGSKQENINYCTKNDNQLEGPWTFGDASIKQGTRTDLMELKKYCDEPTRTERDVSNQYFAEYLRYHNGIRRYLQLSRPQRSEITRACIHFGPSGTGKTRLVQCLEPDAFWYSKTQNAEWFDGYTNQTTIVFDEFNTPQISIGLMNRIMGQSSPLKLNVKGGQVDLIATKAIVTTNKLPHLWYKLKGTPLDALLRRFCKFLIFTEYEEEKTRITCCKDYKTFIYVLQELKHSSDIPFFMELDLQHESVSRSDCTETQDFIFDFKTMDLEETINFI